MLRSSTYPMLSLFLALFLPAGLQGQTASPKLSDPEVAHVAVTANSIDIDLAKLAQSRTSNRDVKQFATTMITDHSAVNAQATALATKLGVTPKDNEVSQSLLKGAGEARAVIEPLKGKAFDKAYIDREVAYHQAVIEALDKVLVPNTSNAELKKLLVDVRPAFEAHLAQAKKLQGALGAAK
jgi:putative membrane protein